MGVSEPPTLAMMKMKKTTWYFLMWARFIRRYGRIRSMAAPVVPKTLATTAPIRRSVALTNGMRAMQARRPTKGRVQAMGTGPGGSRWTTAGGLRRLGVDWEGVGAAGVTCVGGAGRTGVRGEGAATAAPGTRAKRRATTSVRAK